MTYKIKRTPKLHDTLELVSENGNTVRKLDVEVDIGIISNDILAKYERFVKLNNELRELQKRGMKSDFNTVALAFVNAVDELLSMCFSDNVRLEIYEFFENDYIEMVKQVVPYIVNRILPESRRAANEQKKALKQAFKRHL